MFHVATAELCDKVSSMAVADDGIRIDSALSSPETSPRIGPITFPEKVSDTPPSPQKNASPAYLPDNNSHPQKQIAIDFTDCSQILVGYGPSPSYYAVPRALLTNCSPIFENRYRPQWGREQASEPIYLPHVHPDIFNAFLNWLYRPSGEELVGSPETLLKRKCTRCKQDSQDWDELFLIDMYIFTHPDHYYVPGLRPVVLATLEKFYHRQQALPSRKALELATKSLPENDELILLMMAFYVFGLREGRMFCYETVGLGQSLDQKITFWYHYAGHAYAPGAKAWKPEVREKVARMQETDERVDRLCRKPVIPAPCACVGREDGFSAWLMT